MCMLLGFTGLSVSSGQVQAGSEQLILPGVYLDGVCVGGMTREEALAEYSEYIADIADCRLSFTTDLGVYTTTLGELHISVSPEEAVDAAMEYGHQGNILFRYKEIAALDEENVVLVPRKRIDKGALRNLLEHETDEIVLPAKDAVLTRENGEFSVTEGEEGTCIQTDETISRVEEQLAKPWKQKDLTVEAVTKVQKPRYDAEVFAKVDSVMGRAETGYNPGNANRSQNLVTGAGKISGTVLMPGEQFSVYNTVSPFTEENGYANAGQYVNNELVDGLGGGICQVSTTLYNAVIKAELQVDERYPHSLGVSYVDPSRDAAIAGTYMDFKFTNNTEYPIYIDGYAGGGTISFAIYGHDERPADRTLELEAKVIETYEPGEPEVIRDDTLPEGTRIVEQDAHTGYYAELWKNIFIDGVQVDSVRVNTSKYNAQSAKVRVGTKKVEKPKEEVKPKEEKEENTENSSEGKKKKKTEAAEENVQTEEVTVEAPVVEEPEPVESEGETE